MYQNIRNILNSDVYKFLYQNEHLNNNIILLGLGGSFAYGTNIETSDLDIRGIALERSCELIGLQNFEQFEESNTDTVIYGFNKIIKLLYDCNPNILEILGLNSDQYFYLNPIGEELIKNKQLFLSQKCYYTFSGYANANLKRLQNALARDNYPEEDKNAHICLALENSINDFNKSHTEVNPSLAYVSKEGKLRYKLDVDLSYSELEDLYSVISNVNRTYKELLNRNRKKDDLHLNKHAMHLVRLLLMCIDLLSCGVIKTNRDDPKEHALLMDIRNGKYMNEQGNMSKEFYDLVAELKFKNEEALKHSVLPKKPDYTSIENFVMCINKKIINNEANYEFTL